MIVKFSTNILNEQDIEVPPCMTWMGGVDGKDSLDENERDCYGLKILFILMCSPRAKNKELKYLDNFINGPEFSLESIASMSVSEIAENFKTLECKTRMHITFSKLSKKLSIFTKAKFQVMLKHFGTTLKVLD